MEEKQEYDILYLRPEVTSLVDRRLSCGFTDNISGFETVHRKAWSAITFLLLISFIKLYDDYYNALFVKEATGGLEKKFPSLHNKNSDSSVVKLYPDFAKSEQNSTIIESFNTEFVLIISNQRSASTSVAHAIGSNKCATSFNEFLGNSEHYSSGLAPSERGCVETRQCDFIGGGCRGTMWRNRITNFLDTYNKTRNEWCGRRHNYPSSPWSNCGETCVISSKIHGIYFKKEDQQERYQLKRMMGYPGTRVVVVERLDKAKQQCSLRYSKDTGVWHGGNRTKQTKWMQKHCTGNVTESFEKIEREWYGWVRMSLAELNKTYLDLPYEVFTSDAPNAEARLHVFAGLPSQRYRGSCVDGCNCA